MSVLPTIHSELRKESVVRLNERIRLLAAIENRTGCSRIGAGLHVIREEFGQ